MNFFYLLTSHERKVSFLLLIMILIMSLLDTIGVASIIPFISVQQIQNLYIQTQF